MCLGPPYVMGHRDLCLNLPNDSTKFKLQLYCFILFCMLNFNPLLTTLHIFSCLFSTYTPPLYQTTLAFK